MNSEENKILVVSCFGHFICHYNLLVFPALVLPLTASLNMEMGQVLQLSFMQFLLFGVTALPWGMAGDKLGGKPLMVLMFLGSAVSGFAAAYFINSPNGLYFALAGIGLFSGIYHPIGIGLISKGIKRLNVAMGYNAAFGGLGLVVAPLLTGFLNWLFNPQAAYIFLGIMNLAGLGIMATLPKMEPILKDKRALEKSNNISIAFIFLLIAMMLGGLAFTGSTVILPAYLELKNQDLFHSFLRLVPSGTSSNLFATAVAAFIYFVGMLGQFTGGFVGERFEPRYTYLAFHLICIPAAFLMAFYQDLSLVFLASIYFFFMLGMQPMENTLVALLAPRHLHHSAFGLKFILTFGVGALAVKMVGWIDSKWGGEATFIALGILSILLVTSIIFMIHWTNRSPALSFATIGYPAGAQVDQKGISKSG